MKFNISFALGLSYCSVAAYGSGRVFAFSKELLFSMSKRVKDIHKSLFYSPKIQYFSKFN